MVIMISESRFLTFSELAASIIAFKFVSALSGNTGGLYSRSARSKLIPSNLWNNSTIPLKESVEKSRISSKIKGSIDRSAKCLRLSRIPSLRSDSQIFKRVKHIAKTETANAGFVSRTKYSTNL
jgi:hypothetical protein